MQVKQVSWHGALVWALVSGSGQVLRIFGSREAAKRNLARRMARAHVVGAESTTKRAAKPAQSAGTPTPAGAPVRPWRRQGRIQGLVG